MKLELAFILATMRLCFSVPIHGSLPLLFFAGTLYVFTLLAAGLWIAVGVETHAGAFQQAQVLLLRRNRSQRRPVSPFQEVISGCSTS